MSLKSLAACAVLFAGVVGAHAASATVVLYDNFNSDTQMLNWTGDSVFTSVAYPNAAGNVASTDLIGTGFYNFYPGNGNYVDLDGTTGYGNAPYAGVVQSKASFGPGEYTLSFDLGGNARGAPAQTTVVDVGGRQVASITLDSNDPFKLYTFNFKTTAAGPLTFYELGPSDQQGNVLDNVTLASVPEPSTWAMLILGVAMIGFAARRRTGAMALAA
jgi:PEP-CTERM motif